MVKVCLLLPDRWKPAATISAADHGLIPRLRRARARGRLAEFPVP